MQTLRFPRRYAVGLCDAVDALIACIATWEDGIFSASAVELTSVEAERIAAILIDDVLVGSFLQPAGIDGVRLLQELTNLRSDFSQAPNEEVCDG